MMCSSSVSMRFLSARNASPQPIPFNSCRSLNRFYIQDACCRRSSILAQRSDAIQAANPSKEVVDVLRRADAFAFDVDSTFCQDESIDELANYLNVGEEVAAMTARAMGGSVDFKTALTARLSVMKPSRASIEQFLVDHPYKVTKGIPELVALIRAQGKEIFLVSGGFRQIINPLALSLGIPEDHVFANSILFDETGAYAGFDEREFTCQSGGKPAALRHIKERHGHQSVVMIGDGATDLEARLEGVASLFVGYGGVVNRPNIAAKADWYILDIQELLDVMEDP